MVKSSAWTKVAGRSSTICCSIVVSLRSSRLIWFLHTGNDLRGEQVIDRKAALRRLLRHIRKDEPLVYVDHVEHHGEALFQRVCELDLEGIVATLKSGIYVGEREKSALAENSKSELLPASGQGRAVRT